MNRKLHNPKANAPALYIPCWLSQVSTQLISNSAKILYGRLAQWSDEKGQVYRSSPQLSQEIGATVRNVERYLKELRDLGLIGTYQAQAGGVNHFEFYEHEWMYEPIKEQLVYKTQQTNPPSNVSVPPVRNVGTPLSKVADINIKEIKRNKINNIRTSGEALFVDNSSEENKNQNKTALTHNQALQESDTKQEVDNSGYPTKSDYDKNQIKNKSDLQNKNQYDLNSIQENNRHQIPTQMILDWILGRKKKRAAITRTCWDKIQKELDKCKDHGLNPIEVFESYVMSAYQGFEADWFIKNSLTSKKIPPTQQWDIDSVMRA